MSGSEAWSIIAPMIKFPEYDRDSEPVKMMTEVYVLCHIGLMLYDSWVAHGKPDDWRKEGR